MTTKRSFKYSIVSVIIGGVVFLGLFTYLLIIINTTKTPQDEIGLGFLAISYQVIFLTTSLLSMLSDRSETIYWERFTEYVMVTPHVVNFTGLSIAGYVSLIVQTICFFKPDWRFAFFISFSIGIAIIIILWWKMSSIFFFRDYYKNKLKSKEDKRIKELQEKNDPDKRKEVYANLDSLREYTYSATDDHNYRAIDENLDYLVELICCNQFADEELRYASLDTIRHIFDYLHAHNESERIINFLERRAELLNYRLRVFNEIINDSQQDNDEFVKHNLIVSYEIARWIIQDVDRSDIWKTLRKTIINDRELLSQYIKYFYCKYYPYSISIEKGKEDDARNLQEQYDDVETIAELRKEYEKFILDYASFALKNNIPEEIEVLVERLLLDPDLIKACPRRNVILDSTNSSDSFDLIYKAADGDDHLLSLFITAYSTVVFMLKYEDVQWDSERDEEIVDTIMNIYNKKTGHDPILDSVYETFMREFVPASSAARKKYVKKLAETGEYEWLESVISYDNNVFDFIKDQDQLDVKSESYYRVFLYLKGIECSIVAPIENVYTPYRDSGVENSANESEVNDEPAIVESDKNERDSTEDEQKGVVLEGVNNSLIKMEFRPTGKDKKEMIDFWSDIRELIPGGEEDVLKELDDYLDILTGAKVIATEESEDNSGT